MRGKCDYCRVVSDSCVRVHDRFNENIVCIVCSATCAIDLAQQDKRTYITEHKYTEEFPPIVKCPCPQDAMLQLAYGTAIIKELKRIDKTYENGIWKDTFAGVKALLNCVKDIE